MTAVISGDQFPVWSETVSFSSLVGEDCGPGDLNVGVTGDHLAKHGTYLSVYDDGTDAAIHILDTRLQDPITYHQLTSSPSYDHITQLQDTTVPVYTNLQNSSHPNVNLYPDINIQHLRHKVYKASHQK